MSRQRPLRGECSCGRNIYTVVVPTSSTEQAQVFFDDSSHFRRAQATPLTAWLRVPITWVSSTTVAQFPDESHSTIRRVFTPPHEPHCKRFFCGYCGTHLSYWTERPASEAEYLSITLGSLHGDDIRALQDLDLLPEEVDPEEIGSQSTHTDVPSADTRIAPTRSQEVASSSSRPAAVQRSTRSGRLGDLDWFEELIDGSKLGRTQRTRRGAGLSEDGTTQVQWEVSEYVEGDDDSQVPAVEGGSTGSKRKHGDVGQDDDITMKQ